MDSKKRFSKRADHYAKYRPRYSDAVLHYLERELSFSQASIVADVGSGTGILSEMFLKNGNMVFGIEPNEDMRKMAEANLLMYPNFRSINGSAESTTLAKDSVDFITAAQSFHWFDAPLAKVEFRRILRNGGWVILIWNTRKTSTPFLHAYDQMVREASKEKRRVRHEDLDDTALSNFLGDHRVAKLPNFQELGYEGLVGRFLSSSYAPLPGEPRYEQKLAKLTKIFNRYQANGAVRFEYETEVYSGQLF